MGLFDLIRLRAQAPQEVTRPSVGSRGVAGRVTEQNQLLVEVDSLEGFVEISQEYSLAKQLLAVAVEARSYKQQDGTEGDFDQRLGHVVLPEKNFEYHPDSETFTFTQKNFDGSRLTEVKGQGDQISMTVKNQGRQTESANWNTSDGSLAYQRRTNTGDIIMAWPTKLDYPIGSLVTDDALQVDGEGKFQRPQASSLKEAKALIASSVLESGQRAQELIASATQWHERAQALEGRSGVDLNPDPQAMVAVKYQVEDVPENWKDPVVFSRNYKVDLESDASSVFVAAPNGAEPAILSASFQEGGMDVLLQDFHGQFAEKLTWDKTAGRVQYQKFEMENTLIYDLDLPDGYAYNPSKAD